MNPDQAWPNYWDPDDDAFWSREGRRIANRNLWISIPNLLLAFAVWIYWGMVAKYIQQLHFASGGELFNFTFMNGGEPYAEAGYRALLFTLPAVAGLAGATLRIPNSFMIAICGGRNVKFMTSALLILPAVSAGSRSRIRHAVLALHRPRGSFRCGGGRVRILHVQHQLLLPEGEAGAGARAERGTRQPRGQRHAVPDPLGDHLRPVRSVWAATRTNTTAAGATSRMWIQNAGLVWVPILVLFSILAFFGMNNLPFHKVGSTPVAVGKYLWLTFLGFVGGSVGIVLLILPWGGFPVLLKTFVIVVVAVAVTLTAMRYMTPRETRESLDEQFGIFKMKHNWIMTYLYVMTFGSFIGYANAFPKLIDDVFGVIRVGEMSGQATGLSSAAYIWIGAGVGALIRPLGGWLSDKLGGARVTHWDTIVMIASTIGAGYVVSLALESTDPAQYFFPFLGLFIVLFATTGIGNGSTFRMIGVIFKKDNRGPVLGWTSAIAAYGAYLIPKIFATQIQAGTPQNALYGFAAYYATCLALNWWFYARKNAEIAC